MDTQPKKSFIKRFWWIFVIAGIGLAVLCAAAISGLIHDRQLKNQDDDTGTRQKSTAEFAWPDPNAKTITAVPLDLSQIQAISKYRSCAGHDRAGYNFNRVLETDRSMKHYVYPVPEFQGTVDKVKMFAPFDGTVAMVQWVSPDGTEVRSDWLHKDGVKDYGQAQKAEASGRTDSGSDIDLVSALDENAVFGFRHVVFSRDFQIGDTVKAGEFIGYASVSEKENDFDIDYVGRMYKPEDGENIEVLDSMFGHMTPAVLAEFAKYGLTPENTSFTKVERDAKPCGYDPVTKYGSTACEESPADTNNQSSGRDNDCWVQLKLTADTNQNVNGAAQPTNNNINATINLNTNQPTQTNTNTSTNLNANTAPDALSIITPYVNESDVSSVNEAFGLANSNPYWGFRHPGVDFMITKSSIPVRAAASGTVSSIEIAKENNQMGWHAGFCIQHNNTYGVCYNLETFSQSDTIGQKVRDNLFIKEGQTVKQGDVIANLVFGGDGAHIDFGVTIPGNRVCPEPFFTADAKASVLRLIHKDHPTWPMCTD